MKFSCCCFRCPKILKSIVIKYWEKKKHVFSCRTNHLYAEILRTKSPARAIMKQGGKHMTLHLSDHKIVAKSRQDAKICKIHEKNFLETLSWWSSFINAPFHLSFQHSKVRWNSYTFNLQKLASLRVGIFFKVLKSLQVLDLTKICKNHP